MSSPTYTEINCS